MRALFARLRLLSRSLFWKFFLAFWLTLLLAGSGAGLVVWWNIPKHQHPALSGGPRTALLLHMAESVLIHGDETTLRHILRDWSGREAEPIFAVDENDRELLGRPVSADAIAAARKLAAGEGDINRVRSVTVSSDHTYLLFVPFHSRRGPNLLPFPPPLPGERGVKGEPGFKGDYRFKGDGGPRFDGGVPPGLPLPWVHLLAGVLASLAFSAGLAWYVVKPIGHLRQAFRAVAAGALHTRVRPRMGRRRDEFSDLGHDFDSMTGQLEALISAQRRLLHDISHELRSPLARLQAAIGLVRQNPKQLEAMLERLEREITRLDELVDEVLTIARLDSGLPGATSQTFDLLALLDDVMADAQFEAEAINKCVTYHSEGEAQLTGRADLLVRAVENVVRNAIRYTPEGECVEVQGCSDRTLQQVRITVSDRGPGVAEDELETIFQPFYRSPGSPSGSGYGLGLAIARRAIEAHGGQILARNRVEGGLRVEIILPWQSAVPR